MSINRNFVCLLELIAIVNELRSQLELIFLMHVIL